MHSLLLLNELRKELLLLWSYKYQWLSELFALFVFFFFLSHLGMQSTSAGDSIPILGFLVWFFFVTVAGDMSGKIASEFLTGTFEQLYLAAVPLYVLIFAKILSSFLKGLLLVTSIGMFLFFYAGAPFDLKQILAYCAILMLISPCIFGASLLFSGLTLSIKTTGSLPNIFNNALLFFSGIFIPLDRFPPTIQWLSCCIPTSLAYQALKLGQGYLALLFLSLSYLLMGGLVYLWCEKRARLSGNLGYY